MLPESLTALGSRLGVHVDVQTHVTGIAIDSRRTETGDLFVALHAARDGHDFIADAKARGAVAALVTRQSDELPSIVVNDTAHALTTLARQYRQAYQGPVLALTGSQGKTSTRGFIEAIMRQTAQRLSGSDILVTQGNLNNQLGVPLTVSRLRAHHACAVFELGASAVGDIAHIASIVKPRYSALLNARAAHLEGFGSIAGVVQGKGEIIDHTDSDGCCVLNADEPAFETWKARAGSRHVTSFGRTQADVTWRPRTDSQVTLSLRGDAFDVVLPTIGHHFMENAAAACALTSAAGATVEDMVTGLESARIEPGRMTPIHLPSLLLVDDTYNASPEAVTAAIDWLAGQQGRRVLVLGGLAELGQEASSVMYQLGAYAKDRGIESLVTVAEGAPIAHGFGAGALHFESVEALASELDTALFDAEVVVVKGSRASQMERVISLITASQGVC
jgi:UDP-N-acetylmuramoyl-tripeptide--D-alanyl-D-alanine ligase